MPIKPSSRLAVLLAATLAGCGAQGATTRTEAPAPAPTDDLPPAGYGTLHQEDVALKLATGTLQLRIIPLDEHVTRLLAPDSYESLRALAAAHAAQLDSATARRGPRSAPFLVTFFALGPAAVFNADDVTIGSQNRFFRPLATVPLSPAWSERRLGQRETASAIYLFESGIDLTQPLTVSYGGASSDQWESVLRTLDRERARVYARVRGGGATP